MKNVLFLILFCLLLAGCHSESHPENPTTVPSELVQLANPWKSCGSIDEAETFCGLTFPLPEIVADSYVVESCRVLNEELLEVVYRDKNCPQFEVTVRMQAGEGLDLSGVYEEFKDTTTVETGTYTIISKTLQNNGLLQLVSKDGYSYSLYAPNHYRGDSNADFLGFLND